MNTLRARIFAVFIAMLLVIVGFFFAITSDSSREHALNEVYERLGIAYGFFVSSLEQRRTRNADLAEVVGKDFQLHEQIALARSGSGGAESLGEVLDNFRRRGSATFLLAMAPDGSPLASAGDIPPGDFPLSDRINAAAPDDGEAFRMWGNRVVHLFLVPVFAPRPELQAWLAQGYQFGDNEARELSAKMKLQVSILGPGETGNRVLASSLDAAGREALEQTSPFSGNGHETRELGGETQVLYSARLDTADGKPLVVVLQRSLTEALRSYNDLRTQLLWLTLGALTAAAIAAYFIAGTVTRPLAHMIAYVRRIGAGDYSADPPVTRSAEIGILVAEFRAMRTGIAEREQAITHLAYHDTLTDLPNRNEFRRTLQQEIEHAEGRYLVVLIMDLDNFKDINDTLGHVAGDNLLREAALRLGAARRAQDHVARLGGDEFAILLTGVERHEVIPLTLRYREALAQPIATEGIELHINCTVGIAIYPDHGENAGTLLQRADVAMYVGKENHLPYCLYNIREDRHSLLRLTLMSELKGAIERNELTLYYQPKIEVASGRVTAIECLVRWIHPQHGFIAPDEFIPLAEQTGNVRYLTAWVLETALAQSRAWSARGIALHVAVNVSTVDLQDGAFIDRLAGALERHQHAPGLLTLEITESEIMRDPAHAVAQLNRLHGMGVLISIDDFGTGYSSMAQLKHLPVSELKIDKSFVLNVVDSEDDATIVRSIVELGHNMGLQVVAEGVENERALELLRSFGCDWAQGYHFAKPLPAADLEAWLRSRHGFGPHSPVQEARA